MSYTFIQINDPHQTDHAPTNRTDAFSDEVFDKLVWAFEQARLLSATAILIPGDLFHNPAATKNSHLLVSRWLRILSESPCPIIAVPGNHDLAGGRIDSLSRQPLFSLSMLPNFTLLSRGQTCTLGGFTVCGVHWTPDAVSLRPFLPAVGVADILLLHAPISQNVLPGPEYVDPVDIGAIAKVVCFGHIHAPEPVFRLGRTVFSNPGALARAALTEVDVQRTPQIAVLSFDDRRILESVNYVSVSSKPAHEVFKLTQVRSVQANNQAVEDFVANLKNASVQRVTTESLFQAASEITSESATLEAIRSILYGVVS